MRELLEKKILLGLYQPKTITTTVVVRETCLVHEIIKGAPGPNHLTKIDLITLRSPEKILLRLPDMTTVKNGNKVYTDYQKEEEEKEVPLANYYLDQDLSKLSKKELDSVCKEVTEEIRQLVKAENTLRKQVYGDGRLYYGEADKVARDLLHDQVTYLEQFKILTNRLEKEKHRRREEEIVTLRKDTELAMKNLFKYIVSNYPLDESINDLVVDVHDLLYKADKLGKIEESNNSKRETECGK